MKKQICLLGLDNEQGYSEDRIILNANSTIFWRKVEIHDEINKNIDRNNKTCRSFNHAEPLRIYRRAMITL